MKIRLIEEADKPYSYKEVEQELKSITDNFTDKDGTVKCFFPEEKEHAMKVLRKHYKIVEPSDGRRSKYDEVVYVLAYAEPKGTKANEAFDESLAPDDYSPKVTGKAYKVFRVKKGKLYPPMVANPGGEDTPVGVWLTADEGEFAGLSKTGRKQVKSTGSGTLSYRPGWHLGDIPLAKQFYRTNKETGEKEFPADFVWALCDYVMEKDYQDDAMKRGYTKNGKFQHSLAGLDSIPKDGYYKYRTNPDPDTVSWVITGAMKVDKLLSDAEVKEILAKQGIEAPKRQGGDKTLAELGLNESMRIKKKMGYSMGEGKNTRKIDLYINGDYVCSSTRYSRTSDFVNKVKEAGKVTYSGMKPNGSLGDVTVTIKDSDKVTARFAEQRKANEALDTQQFNTVLTQNKYEKLFDDFLDLVEFSLVKRNNGEWSVVDQQGVNLGDIESDVFRSASDILDRMEIYENDYIFDDLAEQIEDKLGSVEYDYYEELLKYRDKMPENYGREFDYVDMICNHADDIDLNNCTYEDESTKYSYVESVKQCNHKPLKEEFTEDEKIEALAKYLNVSSDTIRNIGGDEYESSEGDYLILDGDEAYYLASDYIREFIDELGIGGFSEDFQEWIKGNALDSEWFEDAMRESNEYYVEDIESENDSKYGNRLIQEMYDAEILTDDDFVDDDGDIDYTQLDESVDFEDKKEAYIDYLCDRYEDAIEWYSDNSGDRELTEVVKTQNVLDVDKVVEEVIDQDGIANSLSTYDGEEIELGDGLYAYRTN